MDSISSMDLLGREKVEVAGEHTESIEATDGSLKEPCSLLGHICYNPSLILSGPQRLVKC